MIYQVLVLTSDTFCCAVWCFSFTQVLNTGQRGGDASTVRIFCLLNFYKVILVGDFALELRKRFLDFSQVRDQNCDWREMS